MPWGRVGPAHTQRERTKTSEGEEERNTEESTYNRKQRNFTCSVVLMHQSTDRERDRQMERRRACEKTWIVTLIWRSTASCPALAFWKERRDQRCSDSASAVRGGGVRLNRKSHRRGGASARSGPCCSEVMGREPKNPPLLPLPASSRSPRSHTGAPTLKESPTNSPQNISEENVQHKTQQAKLGVPALSAKTHSAVLPPELPLAERRLVSLFLPNQPQTPCS